MQVLLVGLVLAVLTSLGTTQSADAEVRFFNTQKREQTPLVEPVRRLRFVTTTGFAPFNYADTEQRIAGFHVDLARRICGEVGILDACSIQATRFEEIEGLLQLGTVDAALAGHAITPERLATLSFSEPYFRWPHRFLAPRDSDLKEPMASALLDRRVGVMRATVHEVALRAFFKNVVAVVFDSEALMVSALKNGSIAAIYGDGVSLGFEQFSERADNCCRLAGDAYFAPLIRDDRLAVMVRPDQPAVRDTINRALRALQNDGTMDELLLRWFPFDLYRDERPSQ